jgi:hypothetical protein
LNPSYLHPLQNVQDNRMARQQAQMQQAQMEQAMASAKMAGDLGRISADSPVGQAAKDMMQPT